MALILMLSLVPASAQRKHRKQPDQPKDLDFPLESIYADRKPDTFRKFLHLFSVMPYLSTGRGMWSHTVSEDLFYRKGTGELYLFPRPKANDVKAHSSWITANPTSDLNIGVVDPDEFLLDTDTAKVKFTGLAPVRQAGFRLMARVWKVQVGAGISKYGFRPANLTPGRYARELGSISTSAATIGAMHYSGYLAYDFYAYYRWRLRGDLELGKFTMGKKFTATQFKPSMTIGVGLTARWELSEYLSWFIRPSVDIWSYTIQSPETAIDLRHRIAMTNLSTGFVYNFPELRKCYHKACRVQINHPHGNREYRSRAHPIYRKQNPGYGENYPEPIKTPRPKF